MAKSETASTTPEREILPIAPRSVTIDQITFSRKYAIVALESSITLDDCGNKPELFRLVQQDRNKALAPNDHVELRGDGWTAFAYVNEIDAGKVFLYGIRKVDRPKRTAALFEDDKFKIEMRGSVYAVYRKGSNDRLPYGGKTFSTVDQARRFIAEQYPTKAA